MRDIILESIKKVRMFETRVLSEALTPEEEKELQSIAQEVIGTVESGVDGIPPEVIKAVNDYKSSGKTDSPSNKPTDKPTDKPTGTGKVGPANPGTRAIQHYLNTKHGQKLDVDGRDGPLTTAAIRSLSGKVSTDEYANIAGLAYAYNVKPGQGPGTVSLGNPEFVKRMTALGYDPKTGNPVGGAKPTAGSGQGASPTTSTGIQPGQNARDDLLARQGSAKKVNTADTQALENSIKAIEAILAKNKVKAENIHPDDALVLENISNFTSQEQMEIWSTLIEAGPRTAAQQASMQAAATGVNPAHNPFGLTPGGEAPTTSKTGKLAKFTSKLGGASGIGRKIAARAGASALSGPAALIVGAGMAAWTAYDVGKALYDTFKDDELPSMDPADQEAIKKHMAVILQYQKNTDMMAELPPELKTRLESALKGLDKVAAGANNTSNQAASPAASAPTSTNTSTSTQSKQSVSGTLRMGKPDGPIEFNGKTVNPGDPEYAAASQALIASKQKMPSASSTSPTKESITQSEDDTILAMIRAVR